jgi:hypothetical protein
VLAHVTAITRNGEFDIRQDEWNKARAI